MRYQANLTVGSVLALSSLRGAELVAGRDGLNRRVAGVNIIEVPDVARWLHGQEFLLSSMYLWRDRPDDLSHFLVKLAGLGVAALGHKPSEHLARLPRDALDTADELGFPIVQLPAELPYREVFEGIYMLRFGQHRSTLAPDLGTQLGLASNDHSMVDAVSRLSREFQVRVELVDSLEGVIHVSDAQGLVRSDPSPVFDEMAALGLRADHEPYKVIEGRDTLWVAPLLVDGKVRGRLKVPADSSDVDLPTVMQMTDLFSLLQIRRRSFRQGLHGAMDLTFSALVRGTLGADELVERAKDLYLVEGGRWRLGLVHLDGPIVSEGTIAQLRRALDRQLSPATTVLAFNDAGEPRVVLLARGGESSMEDTVALLRGLVPAPNRFRMGWSATADHPGQVPEALREAHVALAVCGLSERSDVAAFDRLGAEAIIAQIPCGGLSDSFVARWLGKLNDAELVRTLELYVAHQGNKTATAKAIPMHRSGLLYRLKKIGEQLGADLDDPEVLHEIWLALKLRWVQRVGG